MKDDISAMLLREIMGKTESVHGRRQYYDEEAVSLAGDDDFELAPRTGA